MGPARSSAGDASDPPTEAKSALHRARTHEAQSVSRGCSSTGPTPPCRPRPKLLFRQGQIAPESWPMQSAARAARGASKETTNSCGARGGRRAARCRQRRSGAGRLRAIRTLARNEQRRRAAVERLPPDRRPRRMHGAPRAARAPGARVAILEPPASREWWLLLRLPGPGIVAALIRDEMRALATERSRRTSSCRREASRFSRRTRSCDARPSGYARRALPRGGADERNGESCHRSRSG